MTDDRRFSGVSRLFGEDARDRFAHSRVAVIGIGGVGSWAAEALARTGIGQIVLIDLDVIAESNTNRQIHALGDRFGQAKVVAMADRIAAINPACRTVPVEEFVSPENVGALLDSSLDYVIDAIDHTRAKIAIGVWCRDHSVPLIMAGAAGGRRDPTRIRIDDLARTTGDSLLSRVRQQLRKHHRFPREAQRRFGISAVFSDEQMSRPETLCQTSGGLNCAGYGSSVAVTGGFGFSMAAKVLDHLASASVKSIAHG